jgi:hypothetical protein
MHGPINIRFTNFMFNNFSENCAVYERMWENIVEPDSNGLQCGACTLRAEYQTLQSHTQNVQYLLLFLLLYWFHERTSITLYVLWLFFVCFICKLWCRVELAQILVFSVGHLVWSFVLEAACFSSLSDMFSIYTRRQNFKSLKRVTFLFVRLSYHQ